MNLFLGLAALLIIGLTAIWLYVRVQIRRALNAASLTAEMRKEVRNLNIELNEVGDRNISLIEDRITKLKEILELVDKRILLLKTETERKDQEKLTYARLNPNRPVTSDTVLPSVNNAGAQAELDIIPPVQQVTQGINIVQGKTVIPPKSKREEILELAQQGFSADLIAQKLALPIAEVELFLALGQPTRSLG